MKRIVITGATGWVGRAMIEALISEYGASIIDRLELYGSRQQTFVSQGSIKHHIASLETIDLTHKIDLFIPLAFLTQEKYNHLGPELYRKITHEIISSHSKIIQATKPKTTLYFSSGITSSSVVGIDRAASYLEYRKLKLEEEETFRSLIAPYKGFVITCRLFSMSGQFMRDPEKYALGNFILQAFSKNRIEIQSPSLVYRKYCQDIDLCTLMLRLAAFESDLTFESSGNLIEIGELAKLVGEFFNLSDSSIVRGDLRRDDDVYYSQDTTMDDLFIQHGLRPHSLLDQVSATIKGVLADAFENQ